LLLGFDEECHIYDGVLSIAQRLGAFVVTAFAVAFTRALWLIRFLNWVLTEESVENIREFNKSILWEEIISPFGGLADGGRDDHDLGVRTDFSDVL
jgi:hypothetical protein